MDDVADLYDRWADDYDAAHADWRAWVDEHGSLLAEALAARGIEPPATVLDCTCGIGTQAIGLARLGYTVTGTDISAGEIERARREATGFGVDVRFEVADLLDPAGIGGLSSGRFDAVLSANSLTHFHDRDVLDRVIATMAAAVVPGGVVVITNRDYDVVTRTRPTSTQPQSSECDGTRRISFQLWEWESDGSAYRMEDVLLTAPAGAADPRWTVRSRVTHLRAWQRADIERSVLRAGLTDIEWTQRGAQPILTSRISSADHGAVP